MRTEMIPPEFQALCLELRDAPERMKSGLQTLEAHYEEEGDGDLAKAVSLLRRHIFPRNPEFRAHPPDFAYFDLSLQAGIMIGGRDFEPAAVLCVAIERAWPGCVIGYIVPGMKAGDTFPPGWEPGSYLRGADH